MSMGRTSKYKTTSFTAEKPNTWKCGIYLRLSREDGDKMESDSIINQRKIIDRYLEKNQDIDIFDVYTDDGYTGTNFDRPDMSRLLDDIKARKVNCLIVKDLSRFGRNYHETGRYLEVVFPLLRLRFISVNDNIDSYKNPQSMKNSTVSFKNVMNDEYARDISSKIRSSFNAKRKRGEYIGSFALYGYMKDPEDHHRLIIDEEAAENVRLIYQLFLNGMSIYNIALKLKALGILNPTEYKNSKGLKNNNNKLKFIDNNNGWSNDTIRRLLKNRMYTGDMVQGKTQTISHKVRKSVPMPIDKYIIKEGTHEAIIDKDTFEKVQARFQRDTWQHKSTGEFTPKNELATGALYVGYIKCADCGRAMQKNGYIKRGISFYYFICGSYLQWKQCSRHALRVNKLNEVVLTVIQQYVAIAVEVDNLLHNIQNNPATDLTLSRLKKEKKSCELEREKLVRFQNDLYMDFKNEIISKDQYFHFKRDYSEKIGELDLRITKLNDELNRSNPDTESKNSFVEAFKKYQNITILTQGVIEELIKMIYVEHGGGIRIEFNFKDAFKEAVDTVLVIADEEQKAKFEMLLNENKVAI